MECIALQTDRTRTNSVADRLVADCSKPDTFFYYYFERMILGPAFLSGEQIPKLLGKFPSGIFITIYGLAMASTQGEQRHNALLRYHLSPIPLGFLFTKLLNTSLTFVYRINSIINIAKKRDRSSQSNSWTFIVFLNAITRVPTFPDWQNSLTFPWLFQYFFHFSSIFLEVYFVTENLMHFSKIIHS